MITQVKIEKGKFYVKCFILIVYFHRDPISKGQAINLFLGIWFIFGGFLQHIFLCNFLSLLLKPAFDKPIDAVHQIIEKELIPFAPPGKISYRPYFENHPSENFQMLGKSFETAKVCSYMLQLPVLTKVDKL